MSGGNIFELNRFCLKQGEVVRWIEGKKQEENKNVRADPETAIRSRMLPFFARYRMVDISGYHFSNGETGCKFSIVSLM